MPTTLKKSIRRLHQHGVPLWRTADQKRLNAAYYPLGDYPEKVILFLKSHAGDTFQFNASILAVPQVDSWKLQTIVDIVSDATNPIVLELTQSGFLRDVPKLIAGSVDDSKPGALKVICE